LADGDPDHAAPRLIGTTLSASEPVTNALQADMIWRRRSNIELTLIRLHHRVQDSSLLASGLFTPQFSQMRNLRVVARLTPTVSERQQIQPRAMSAYLERYRREPFWCFRVKGCVDVERPQGEMLTGGLLGSSPKWSPFLCGDRESDLLAKASRQPCR
jgi:hypothetical protein